MLVLVFFPPPVAVPNIKVGDLTIIYHLQIKEYKDALQGTFMKNKTQFHLFSSETKETTFVSKAGYTVKNHVLKDKMILLRENVLKLLEIASAEEEKYLQDLRLLPSSYCDTVCRYVDNIEKHGIQFYHVTDSPDSPPKQFSHLFPSPGCINSNPITGKRICFLCLRRTPLCRTFLPLCPKTVGSNCAKPSSSTEP